MITPADYGVVTTRGPHGMQPGDRIHELGQPNAVRAFVDTVSSTHAFRVKHIRRPSRGYAKHIRKQKAGK